MSPLRSRASASVNGILGRAAGSATPKYSMLRSAESRVTPAARSASQSARAGSSVLARR